MIKIAKNGKVSIHFDSLEQLKEAIPVNIPVSIPGFEGYSLEIKLTIDDKLKNTYSEIIKKYEYIDEILKNKKQISWGIINYSEEVLIILAWIYSVYLKYSVIIFLPNKVVPEVINTHIEKFNKQFGESLSLDQFMLFPGTIKSIEEFEESVKPLKKNKLVFLSGYSDILFNDLMLLNKRRFNTQLKKIIKKCDFVHILSVTDLKVLDIDSIKDLKYYQLESQRDLKTIIDSVDIIDLLDYDNQFDPNVLVELILDAVKNENKTFYLLLDLETHDLKNIERLLTEKEIRVSRNESPDCDVVINSCKKGFNVFLSMDYSCYVILPPIISNPIDLIYYLKGFRNPNSIIYVESSRINNIQRNINKILKIEFKIRIKDSESVFDTYSEVLNELNGKYSITDPIMASDHYFRTEYSSIKNLENIPKETYEQIRNFVKFKVEHKINVEIKTCQLSTPCSPKDRSKKLNSLANKVTSFNYRCEVTCELFNDFTIGIVLWNEMFSKRIIKLDKESKAFIYQNTMGKWRYSLINYK